MIETKPRINRGNRGQLFRATWLSSARCSETFRRTTERVECSAKCTWQWPRAFGGTFDSLGCSSKCLATPCWREPSSSKQLSTVAAVDSRFGLYHVAVVLSLILYAVSALLWVTLLLRLFPGGVLGYILGGYVPPGSPNLDPVLERICTQNDTPF